MLPGTQEWMVRDKRITSVWRLDTLTHYASSNVALTNKPYTRNTQNLTRTVSMWVDSLVNTPQTLWLLQHKAGDPTYIFHWLMLCLSTMEYITVSVYICVSIVSFFSGSMNEACTRGVYFVHLFNKHIFIYCLSSPSVHRPVKSYISTRFVCSPSPFPMLLCVQLPFLCTAQVVVALIIMLIKSSS